MEKTQSGDQAKAIKTEDAQEKANAIRIVNEMIEEEEKRLQRIADLKDQEPVLLEGETAKGHYAKILVDPAKVASIVLSYDYALFKILGLELPQDMWAELAYYVGLESVYSVDL